MSAWRRLLEGLAALVCGLLATAAWWALFIVMLPPVGEPARPPARAAVLLPAPRRDARDPERCIVVLDERGRTCIICQAGGVVTMSGEGC